MPMTPCPACGAPLEYTGDGETIRCHFCGTEFRVTEEDARPRFEVLGQPGPQKEALQDGASQAVESQIEDFRDTNLPPAPDQPGGTARIYPSQPDMYQQAYQADLNTPLPPQAADTNRWSGVEAPVQVPPPPQPANPSGADVLRRPGTPGRWIAIGVGVILLLCLACACVAAVVFMAQNGGRFQ